MLLAPPKNHLMLPGITYDVILELAGRHDLPFQVRDVLEEEVRQADELWMTSSTKEVLPIVSPAPCSRRCSAGTRTSSGR